MGQACGKEFSPPRNMIAAALLIQKLIATREALQNQAIHAAEEAAHATAGVAGDIAAAIAGKPVRDGSPLVQLAKTIDTLRSELSRTQHAAVQFVEGVKATLVDRGLTEIPGMVGYFVGATPALRAAEAAAIITHHATDDRARMGYLRARGWIATGNGWKTPPTHIHLGHLPFDAAVKSQVEKDSEPFKQQAATLKDVKPHDPTLAKALERKPVLNAVPITLGTHDVPTDLVEKIAKAIQPEESEL